MQNAWRFVADETLRERLKEAKGIGTPATRSEIIRGLKAQEFLVADGKNIVPTERGLGLHGVLERADPALVDPGVTAQMERLLDDVLDGRHDMMAAIDAVCDQANRIIKRLVEQAGSVTIPASDPPDAKLRKTPKRRSRAKSDAGAGTPTSNPERAQAVKKGRAPRPRGSNAEPTSGDTPLRIPYGNKDAAQALGARYRAGGWYAPANVPLDAFRERGWV
jgi:DNA topoisomerase-3